MAGWAIPAGRTATAAFSLPFDALEGQRGYLFPWVPVCLGTGIGAWFALPVEPGAPAYLVLGALGVLLAALAWRGPVRLRPVAMALALACAGVLLAGYRAHSVAAPVLGWRFYGAIEGRVIEIDRSLSDKPRLTLDQVVLERLAPGETPARVRVSLHGRAAQDVPPAGATVILTGNLSPPQGPAEPGGFDFRRNAWFERIGAVGYTRTPVLSLEPPHPGLGDLAIARLRRAIAEGVRGRMPGEPGAFAAAILTGDRSGIGRPTTQALRDSSLAHLLSISGLHMALVTGFVFLSLRGALALVPPLALRLPVKKIAALAALAVASFYLALSGGETPTTRAFVMAVVMLVAVLVDRQALSLRSIAVAATVILILQPEALVQPGFQMSFAATTALIVAFRAIARRSDTPRRLPGWAAPVVMLLFSSLVAGAATAPYAAAHFNRISDYSLLANTLSVPVMGSIVMPAAVIAALLWPLGLEAPALWVMEVGCRWILAVAQWVSDLPGSVAHVPAVPTSFLPLFTLGMALVALWQGRGRWLGLGPAALALTLWAGTERPVLLIADTGGLIGLLTPEGRALSKPGGDGFIALSWLEDDGDSLAQKEAAARPGLEGPADGRIARIGETEVVQVSGRGWQDRLAAECLPGRILVTAHRADPPGPCTLLDTSALAETGAIALTPGPDGTLKLETAAERAGRRLWTTP